jgi:Fe-S cluster assembly iron-binding protein IscA
MNVTAAAQERLREVLSEDDGEETKVRISQITVGGG